MNTYSINYNTIKLAIGGYSKEAEQNGKNYIGYLLGVNIAPSNYNIEVAISDPLGTTYRESNNKRKTELGLEFGLFGYIKIIDIVYVKAYTGLTVTDRNNHFAKIYPGYEPSPAYNPAGGTNQVVNLLVSLGLAVKIK